MINNGALVEFISGHIVECFKHLERTVSFEESSDVKWGAIGIVTNTYSGMSESTFIKYRIKIVWNNGKLSDTIIGANEDNIRVLPQKETLEWSDFINDLEEYKPTKGNPMSDASSLPQKGQGSEGE